MLELVCDILFFSPLLLGLEDQFNLKSLSFPVSKSLQPLASFYLHFHMHLWLVVFEQVISDKQFFTVGMRIRNNKLQLKKTKKTNELNQKMSPVGLRWDYNTVAVWCFNLIDFMLLKIEPFSKYHFLVSHQIKGNNNQRNENVF